MWATADERDSKFRDETLERRPADPGDVRFEYRDGHEDAPYALDVIDDKGEIIEVHFFITAYERGNMIAAWRESQSRREEADRLGLHPLEIEFAPFGPAWQREQEERGGVFH
jgi:hypothetical protein